MIHLTPHFQKTICDTETPVSLYTRLAQHHSHAFLLESAEQGERFGRFSIIGFDPLKLHVFPSGGKKNPLEELQKSFEEISYAPSPLLPRLQAGFVGYFCYEVARHFEKLDLPLKGAEIPEGIFFLPKNLLIFDHTERTLTLISYSKEDLLALRTMVESEKSSSEISNPKVAGSPRLAGDPIEAGLRLGLFEESVNVAKEKICAGEVFQIVVCQTFQEETSSSPFDLYRKLRLISPSPYMYYLQYPDFSIIGSSPETLVRTEGEEVIIRPIAGTRRRGESAEEDHALEEELKSDIKEQAEHMMLVDLGRNDIGRMARPGTVHVTELMTVEKYSHVMHLVSEVRGRVRTDLSLFDIFRLSFPAGTLTGAPKIRAMEVIADLEKCPRDIYGGAVGYFDLSGNMDFAIAIRTMIYQKGHITLRAGAGIVYDSVPEYENKECLNKARAPLTALTT